MGSHGQLPFGKLVVEGLKIVDVVLGEVCVGVVIILAVVVLVNYVYVCSYLSIAHFFFLLLLFINYLKLKIYCGVLGSC